LLAVVISYLPFAGDVVKLFDTGEVARLFMSLFVGGIAHIITLIVIASAAAWTMGELSEGRRPDLVDVLHALRRRSHDLTRGFLRAAVIVALLLISFIGIPWAIRQLVRYQFMPQAVMLEGSNGKDSLQRSSDLVRGRWWHTGLFIGIIDLILVAGFSLFGLLILVVLRPPFWLLTIVMGLASVIVLPLAAIAITLLYGDAAKEQSETPPSTEDDQLVTA
jgi:phosphoglycerol transferase MdoB-like AlkP superfamily enzyme